MPDLSSLKPPISMTAVDLTTGWEPVPGAAEGVNQNMLSGALDEEAKIGVRTRLIRFSPGAHVPHEFVHDYWEEVYLIEGKLSLGEEEFSAPAFACRPPGTPHGPFKSVEGCLFFEIQYYV